MEQRLSSDELVELEDAKRHRPPSHVPLLKRPLGPTIEELYDRKAGAIAANNKKLASRKSN